MTGPDTESLRYSSPDLLLCQATAGRSGQPPAQLQLVPAIGQGVGVVINQLELQGGPRLREGFQNGILHLSNQLSIN